MDEQLFTRLAVLLQAESVVLASVLDTHGATPRKPGSRMLITPQSSEFSIGGGLAEARVVEAARSLLASAARQSLLSIDLGGGAHAAGICGGRMRLGLRRWHAATDIARATQISGALRAGERVTLTADDLGATEPTHMLALPDVRLLIVGAGHCGVALYELARHLAFDICLHDTRPACFAARAFAGAQTLCGTTDLLASVLNTGRDVYAVLLNRDFHTDIAALRVLCRQPPAVVAMMGSRRRVSEVLRALPEYRAVLHELIAPVGIQIGAETPHEIAVSILAQLIERRSRRGPSASLAQGEIDTTGTE